MRDAPDCLVKVVAWPRIPPRACFFTPVDATPLGAAHAGDAVVLRQRVVQERIVGIEDVEHRAVVLEQVGEELDRLFVHRPAQTDERGKVPIALFIEVIEIVDVQPLAGKFGRQPSGPGVA